MICPHSTYDSMFNTNFYDKVFSLNFSKADVGEIMKQIAQNSEVQKWAVCYSNDETSRDEMKGFLHGNEKDIVDFVKMDILISDFYDVTKRWELLGVEGVVIIPYGNEGFDMLYKLKAQLPNITVIGNSGLDNQEETKKNIEKFYKVFLADSFFTGKDNAQYFANDAQKDTWEIQGYNALRIVIDTAIENNTDNPEEIAKLLHQNGYQGELSYFAFEENGMLAPDKLSYAELKGLQNEVVIIDKLVDEK